METNTPVMALELQSVLHGSPATEKLTNVSCIVIMLHIRDNGVIILAAIHTNLFANQQRKLAMNFHHCHANFLQDPEIYT